VPLLTADFAVLIVLSPTAPARAGSAVYAATAVLLFTVSGIYHRGTWKPRAWAFWRRFDHANIYLFIAGTHTPLALLYLDGTTQVSLLVLVWLCALAGMCSTFVGITRVRWLGSALYAALGSCGVLFAPQFLDGAEQFATWVNVTALALVIAGGVLYLLGGAVYASRRPDPSPRWFGFHEVFHLCTLLAFIAHYVAISVVTYSA
jgi:hemolysin III